MANYIKGKQLINNTLTSDLFNLTTPNSGATLSGATKEYVDSNAAGIPFIQNILNLDMSASTTTNDGDLACTTPLLSTPKSFVRVAINGLEVAVGIGKDCFFSGDGGVTPRENNSELLGDYLYWNGSIAGYQLNTSDGDEIDFFYLINKN
jgi:hypothetical protein